MCSGCDLAMYAGGIPDGHFDAESRRCSVSVTIANVPWVLAEPEPD